MAVQMKLKSKICICVFGPELRKVRAI